MKGRRLEKLSEEIKREISSILAGEMKDPRLGMISVTRVEVSNDLSHAVVYISALGEEDKREESMEALEKARGYVRTELSNRIRMRHAPEIHFRLDRSIEHGIKIAAILEELKGKIENGND
ncbi:MAG: 30S ribosome-binding factor RbfA [Chitinophagales bacterium]